jgi:hypothetical protein
MKKLNAFIVFLRNPVYANSKTAERFNTLTGTIKLKKGINYLR